MADKREYKQLSNNNKKVEIIDDDDNSMVVSKPDDDNKVVNLQQDKYPEIDFSDISLESLKYSDEFRVIRASASQVVLGLESMANRIGEGDTEYRKSLYPALKKIVNDLVVEYKTKLLTTTSDLQKQVFGANLNGVRNNGSLNFTVTTSGVKPNLMYKYAQFGQLLRVLVQRLKFIATRDPARVARYRDNEDERNEFTNLQKLTNDFLVFLDNLKNKWNTTVQEAREVGGINVDEQPLDRSKKFVRKNEDDVGNDKSWNVVSNSKYSKSENPMDKGEERFSRNGFAGRGRDGFAGRGRDGFAGRGSGGFAGRGGGGFAGRGGGGFAGRGGGGFAGRGRGTDFNKDNRQPQ